MDVFQPDLVIAEIRQALREIGNTQATLLEILMRLKNEDDERPSESIHVSGSSTARPAGRALDSEIAVSQVPVASRILSFASP
jgi:hypothetical protein